MRLNLQTDFALRVLMFLAAQKRQASIEEIADAYGISRNHLTKVARHLADMGLISARRGRGGGLELVLPPEEIGVGKVVREMESLSGFVECFERDSNTCPVAGACGLQGALRSALDDFLARLDDYTVADLLPRPDRFTKALAKSPPG
ncbi:Rrf2 family transcriptional regulator [Qipengyuania sp. RANM35]|uniref:RrF2 family transcriptional regulator n=1 Tax=Qipengyuania sp. RANM35 TaxID=3068635 RepID=UPI0034DAD6DB